MMHGKGTSFDRLFDRATPSLGRGGDDEEKPSVHALFSAHLAGQFDLRAFAQALMDFHEVGLTQSSVRLLTSVDAASGRLSFAQFQRPLQDGPAVPMGGAGIANHFDDQAAAIIGDNCGDKVPPASFAPARLNTDISNDPFVKQGNLVEKQQAHGRKNPIVNSNRVSVGNPLQASRSSQGPNDGPREAAQRATRCFIDGEIDRREYEAFLSEVGVRMSQESDLQRLIASHSQAGDGNFAKFSSALRNELAKVGVA